MMNKITRFLAATTAALALYFAPAAGNAGDAEKMTEAEAFVEAVKSGKIGGEGQKRMKAYQAGEASLFIDENQDSASLSITLDGRKYAIDDGCSMMRMGDCRLDGKPDFCIITKDGTIEKNLRAVYESEPGCGKLYRTVRDELIDYHTSNFEALASRLYAKVEFRTFKDAQEVSVVGWGMKYVVADTDGDGKADLFRMYQLSNLKKGPVISIQSKSPDVLGKIGNLIKLTRQYDDFWKDNGYRK